LHQHAHTHSHAPQHFHRAFAIGVVLNVAFVAVEAVAGFIGGSLALLADAGHNLSDVASLLLAWGASVLAGSRASERRTYGFRRVTIVAALLSSLLLLVALGGIVWEALQRLATPAPVAGRTVLVVAAVGVVINGATALLFASGRHGDLNVRGAFLHMAADTGVSVGVLLAGAGILLTGWNWLDPAVSLAIVAVVLVATWGLLRDSFDLVVDAVPRDIDAAGVREYLLSRPGVEDVHDLHIWGLSTTQSAMTAHLVVPDAGVGDAFLRRLAGELRARYGIDHSTIQVERGHPDYPCEQARARCG
jgi:cobalt-zinc-cadmium efflux system protein